MSWDWFDTLGVWGVVIELFIIVFCKIIEVAIGTVRSILVVKGYRKLAAALAIVEILLWVFIASRVITGLAQDPLKGIAYSVGFASGVYIGSLIEQKLAFGMLKIQIIAGLEKSQEIASSLRASGYGVTEIDAAGKDEKRKILMILANRLGSDKIVNQVKAIDEDAVVVLSDITSVKGGFLKTRRQVMK
ncbi:MAG TPA: DUF5698 domain-containing protein [Bacilli bacterium]|nr:DUF5698 domain-containing protein [Bacilli bacterium]